MARLSSHTAYNVIKTALACAALSSALFVGATPVAMAQGGLQSIRTGLDSAAGQAGLNTGAKQDLSVVIGRVINQVMGLLGAVLLGYMLYGGFLWMTSGGDTKGAEKGRATITNAVIGLLVIALAYVITDFVLNSLIYASTGQRGPQ